MQEKFVIQDRQEKLAHAFIEEYLHSQGTSLHALCELPPERSKELMVHASVYASVRLAEIDERARVMEGIHHATDALT
jgi:hypothetical protein